MQHTEHAALTNESQSIASRIAALRSIYSESMANGDSASVIIDELVAAERGVLKAAALVEGDAITGRAPTIAQQSVATQAPTGRTHEDAPNVARPDSNATR